MRRFSSSLVCIALLVCSMLGATIVSTALLAGLVLWPGVFSGAIGEGVCWWGFAAVLCYLLLPDLCIAGDHGHRGLRQGAVTSVANDFAVQAEGFEQESGSMFSRMTIYRDMLQLVASHPLGIGPAGNTCLLPVQPFRVLSGLTRTAGLSNSRRATAGRPLCCMRRCTSGLLRGAFRARKTDDTGLSLIVFSGFVVCCLGSFAPSSSDFNALLWLPVLLCAALFREPEASGRACVQGGRGWHAFECPARRATERKWHRREKDTK